MNKLWDKNIKLKLQKYEKACKSKSDWFLGKIIYLFRLFDSYRFFYLRASSLYGMDVCRQNETILKSI